MVWAYGNLTSIGIGITDIAGIMCIIIVCGMVAVIVVSMKLVNIELDLNLKFYKKGLSFTKYIYMNIIKHLHEVVNF